MCWEVPGAGPVLGSRATCPPVHVWSGSSLGLAVLCLRTPYARLGPKVLGVLGPSWPVGAQGLTHVLFISLLRWSEGPQC